MDSPNLTLLNNFKPELIFFDIDGTLLNEKGNYSVNLKPELERLKNHGVKLAVASGRPKIAAQFLFDELPLNDTGLFCTGAEIYNPNKKDYISLNTLSIQDLLQLDKEISSYDLYCEYYTCDFYTPGNNKDIANIHSQHLRVKPKKVSLDTLIDNNYSVTKLLIGENQLDNIGALDALAASLPQFHFAFAHFLARPQWRFASVVSQAADKVHGFKQLLDHHQVKAENVIAFGDSHSDIAFIKMAGLGVAMGNADKNVKSVADLVTLSANNDGVTYILKQLYR